MKHTLFISCAVLVLAASTVAGQTDIGSTSGIGSVTPDVPSPSINPGQLVGTLRDQVDKFQRFARQTKGKELSGEDCKRIVDAYESLQGKGYQLVPFEFLSRVIAIRSLPATKLPLTAAKLPDKYAELIDQALHSKGLRESPIPVFSEMMIQSPAVSSKPIADQYKQNLKTAKSQLSSALKQTI
jgi:hypothetical protein